MKTLPSFRSKRSTPWGQKVPNPWKPIHPRKQRMKRMHSVSEPPVSQTKGSPRAVTEVLLLRGRRAGGGAGFLFFKGMDSEVMAGGYNW